MTGEMASEDKATLLSKHRTDLSVRRTVVAAERTLMAWIRTAISMIGFGFTIYKFFQYVPDQIAGAQMRHPQAPRNLGLTLVALGTVALTAAAWQHRSFLKEIGPSETHHVWSISFAVAIAVVFIGLLAFFGILLRLGPF